MKSISYLVVAALVMAAVFVSCEEDDTKIRVTGVEWDLLTNTTIKVDEKLTVTGKVTPANHTEDKFSITSSAPEVASVEGSVKGANVTIEVTGVSPGTATISITMTESNISKSVDITVVAKDNGNTDAVQLPETISILANGIFEYDEKNRITKITGDADFTYGYDGDDLVSFSVGEMEITFSKPVNNKITRTEVYGEGQPHTTTIELNEQGYLSYYLEEGDYSWAYEYQNGNLVKKTRMSDDPNFKGIILSITTYTYDDKTSPFYNCKTPKWFLGMFFELFEDVSLANRNNITSVTRLYPGYEGDDGKGNTIVIEDEEETFTYTYTYDTAEFPLTMTNDEDETITFTYIKK